MIAPAVLYALGVGCYAAAAFPGLRWSGRTGIELAEDMGFFDFGTIFFLIAAVVIFFQLRNVLGRRTGNERPPFDPYSASRTRDQDSAQKSENVVSLPRKRMPGETAAETYAAIVAAEMKGTEAHITLRIVSELISATRDKVGAVIDGDPEKVAEVKDVWTFFRDTRSRDPNWKLVATEEED